MYCIFKLHEDDQPEYIEMIEMYAEDYFHIQITPKEVWAIAQKSQNPPHLGNVYIEVLFSKLTNKLEENYPGIKEKIKFDINGRHSHFYINDENMTTCLDFIDAISEFQAEILSK